MSTIASINCAGCLEAIDDGRFLKCYLCEQTFDLLCANVSEARFEVSMTIKHRNTWKCQVCKCKEPKADNSDTPVRADRADYDYDDSISQYEDKSSGELPLTTLEYDESVDNVTKRHERPECGTSATSKFQGSDTFNEDILYLDNVRSIVREELALSVPERMANIISDAVSEKISSPLLFAITRILDRVVILEGMVSKLESGSLTSCGEPNCPSRKRIPRSLPMGSDHVKPLLQEELTQRLPIESDSRMSRSLQLNKIATKLPIQPQGGKSGTTTARKTYKPDVNRKLSDFTASDTNSSIQKPLKDNARNFTDTGRDRDASDGSDGWTEVKRRRIRTALSRATRGSAVAGSTQIEASEWLRHIHLFYVKQGTTDDQVKSHLKSTTGSEEIKVECLRSRGPYASFKLSVPSRLFSKVMAPESWPLNVCVKPWSQTFRRRDEKHT